MAKNNHELTTWLGIIVAAFFVIVVVIIGLLWKPSEEITSFQACKNAGGAILESYPQQCLLNGKTYRNEAQSVDSQPGDYVGLTELDALDKASSENETARVVERDGESLPVTMDYMPGRLNLSIKDGKVDIVQVEGEEN